VPFLTCICKKLGTHNPWCHGDEICKLRHSDVITIGDISV